MSFFYPNYLKCSNNFAADCIFHAWNLHTDTLINANRILRFCSAFFLQMKPFSVRKECLTNTLCMSGAIPIQEIVYHVLSNNVFSVNVWLNIIGDRLIWPYLLPSVLDVGKYRIFLKEILPNLLENAPTYVRRAMWFQHDGASAHFANAVRDYLNKTFAQ